MAIAEISSQRSMVYAGAVGSFPITFPGNVTAGNLLIVIGGVACNGAWTAGTISDTRGASWGLAVSSNVAVNAPYNVRTFIAWAIAPSSGACTVTFSPTIGNSDNYTSLVTGEFSGVNTSTPQDVDGGDTGSGASSSTASDSITTATANALIIGAMSFSDGIISTITPNGSYTELGENENNNTQQVVSGVFRIATTATAYSVDWTIGTTVKWVAQTMSFKPSGGAASITGVSSITGINTITL